MTSVHTLQQELLSPEAERRRVAIRGLASVPPAERTPLLMRALGDSDWRVRKEAIAAASKVESDDELIAAIIGGVADATNVGLRNACLEVVERVGAPFADYLLAAWGALPEEGKKFFVEALGRTHELRVVDLLVQTAQGEDANVSAAALDALANVGGEHAERFLRTRLAARDPFQRLAALDALNRIGASLTWAELEPLASDRLLRAVAVQALGRTESVEAVGPLVAALTDGQRHVLPLAAVALARLCQNVDGAFELATGMLSELPAHTRDALRALLSDGSAEERRAAALVLIARRDEGAIDGIVDLLANDALAPVAMSALEDWGEPLVDAMLQAASRASGLRKAAALALIGEVSAAVGDRMSRENRSRIRGEARSALHDVDETVTLSAVRVLQAIGSASDVDRLMYLAEHGDEEVARACAAAVEAIASRDQQGVARAIGQHEPGSRPSRPALTSLRLRFVGPDGPSAIAEALNDADHGVRRAAVSAITPEIGERALEFIGVALADEHTGVQVEALHALTAFRDHESRLEAAQLVRIVMDSRAASVRAAAARALGELSDHAAEDHLRKLTNDPDVAVVIAAFGALRALSTERLDDVVSRALGHEEAEIVKEALRTAQRSPGTDARAALLRGLTHRAWDVRCVAAELLGDDLDDEVRRALAEQVERETDALVRDTIHRTLRRTVPP